MNILHDQAENKDCENITVGGKHEDSLLCFGGSSTNQHCVHCEKLYHAEGRHGRRSGGNKPAGIRVHLSFWLLE